MNSQTEMEVPLITVTAGESAFAKLAAIAASVENKAEYPITAHTGKSIMGALADAGAEPCLVAVTGCPHCAKHHPHYLQQMAQALEDADRNGELGPHATAAMKNFPRRAVVSHAELEDGKYVAVLAWAKPGNPDAENYLRDVRNVVSYLLECWHRAWTTTAIVRGSCDEAAAGEQ